jgi:RNA polymerase sigma-70 factor (ECF subfamily)
VVEVNRAVALGRAEGAEAGLEVLEPLLRAGALEGYAPLHVAHADLLEHAGETAQAARAYERAAACAENSVTRAELLRRAAALA